MCLAVLAAAVALLVFGSRRARPLPAAHRELIRAVFFDPPPGSRSSADRRAAVLNDAPCVLRRTDDEREERTMRLLWAALPMAGCALMVVFMMRTMGGGARQVADPGPHVADEHRQALEAEAAELRTRPADVEPRSS